MSVKFSVIATFTLFVLVLVANPCVAQSILPGIGVSESTTHQVPVLPDPLTRQAIREVLSGLSDTQVRELLLTELDKMVALQELALETNEPQSFYKILSGWTAALGKRMESTVQAMPKIPGTIANALSKLSLKRGSSSLSRIPGTFFLSFFAGIVAAISFTWLVKNQRTNLRNKHPTGLWSQIGLITVRFLFHGLQLMIFVFAAKITNNIINDIFSVDKLIVRYLITSIGWTWLAVIIARFVLSPSQPRLRLCAVDDRTAWFLTWRTGLIFGWSAFVFGLLFLFREINGSLGDARIGFWVKSIFYILIALTFWQARKGITQIIVGRDEDSGLAWRRFAEFWPVIAIFLTVVQWVIAELIVATGNVNNISPTTLQLSIVVLMVLPIIELVIRSLVKAIWPINLDDELALQFADKLTQTGLIRFGRILAAALIVLFLSNVWGLDLNDIASLGVGAKLAGMMINSFFVLVVAYGLWELLNIVAERQIAIERVTLGIGVEEVEPSDGEGGQGGTRLGTLMPLVQATGHSIIGITTFLAILAQFGINVTPLLAGAGIVGIAVGFGAQALVKDIFSGVFFLIDDAFRKGEYIDLGDVKGKVEKISIRSMQLRHHNGPLNTVPFGEIKYLTNFSRDWVTMKLPLRLTYNTDANKVRKLIKNLGQEMLSDPEVGELFLKPLKSQGVMAMEDSAMIMRVKFTTKPGDQFIVRRFVLNEIRNLFVSKGIRFASREVTVRMAGDKPSSPLSEEQRKAITAAASRTIIDQQDQNSMSTKPTDDR